MPRPTYFASALGLQPGSEQGSEALLPRPYRLMGEREAAREDHLGDVAKVSLYCKRHSTPSTATSVGTCRWLNGVPVRSLCVRQHARQRTIR